MFIPTNTRWIGFDLDDTLHHFKRASGAASESVFEYVEEEFGIPAGELRDTYKGILKNAQSSHFADARTSREHRSERFTKLLNHYSILTPGHIERILDLYDETLAKNLALTEGAEDALRLAKARGFGVFVVSEGPHDAQTATIERLGIKPYIDVLMTSSQEGRSKSDGLFDLALERIGCSPDEVIFLGDSLERDIVPAKASGMRTIYLSATLPTDTHSISSLHDFSEMIKRARPLDKMAVPPPREARPGG